MSLACDPSRSRIVCIVSTCPLLVDSDDILFACGAWRLENVAGASGRWEAPLRDTVFYPALLGTFCVGHLGPKSLHASC